MRTKQDHLVQPTSRVSRSPATLQFPSKGSQVVECGLRPILLASNNVGKALEIGAILGPVLAHSGFALYLPSQFGIEDWTVDETGDTFERNAVLKASTLAKVSGLPAMGEDSGLCVDALDGAPGVRSARWHDGDDAARNIALLSLLQGVPPTRRGARFVCSVAVDFGNGQAVVAEGICRGEIAVAPAGQSGFGYDPVFFIPGLGLTFAQIGPDEKNRLSHRCKALEALAQKSFSIGPTESVTDSEWTD